MIELNTSQSLSNLLIISHDKEEFMLLGDVLRWYFPGDNEDGDKDRLMIKNKYYHAEVKMSNILWQQTQLFTYTTIKDHIEYQTLQPQSNNQKKEQQQEQKQKYQKQIQENNNNKLIESHKKYDLMIMLVNQLQQEQISFSQLDSLIETINPEEFVLLVNTERPEDVWKYEEVILEKCNNFIEIVKDDLKQVGKNKPQWGRGALLNDDDEETVDSGVFSILDRMETTRWRNLVNLNNVKQQHNISEKIIKQQQKNQKEDITMQITHTLPNSQLHQNLHHQQPIKPEQQQHQTHQNNSSDQEQQQQKQQQHQHQQQKSQQQQQIDEDKLEAQMLKFEQMMSQMMSFKTQSTNMKDSQRKQKAEELFMKMFEKMNY